MSCFQSLIAIHCARATRFTTKVLLFLTDPSSISTAALVRSRHYTSSAHRITTTAIKEFDGIASLNSYQNLLDFSIEDPINFWGILGRSRLQWLSPFDEVINSSKDGKPIGIDEISWFGNGKLNVSENCVDRHAKNNPDKVALIWEKDQPGTQQYVTYSELQSMMNRIGNVLRNNGVIKGDRVIIYMPPSPTAVAAMLACARIGAIHSVVFAGFSADALATRIQDMNAETVITLDQTVRGGNVIELKATIDKAVEKCPSIKRVFVSKRTGAKVSSNPLDIPLEQEMLHQSTVCTPEVMDSNDILFLLYTSGSTGKPKGIAHSSAGYLLYAALTHQLVFDYKEGDIFGCMADIGWITGHSYVVYGPLCNGGTTVLFESSPIYPDPGRYWETVERLRISQIYLAPTALRLLLKFGDLWPRKHDLSSLCTLGCVGEPLNHEAWEWYYHEVGKERCPIVDTWWQTETGGICISPRPSAVEASIKPGMPMRPFFGIQPVLIDEQGKVLQGDDMLQKRGALCIKKSWPGIARTLYGNHERFQNTYFKPYSGYFFTGDGAYCDEDGHLRITGRIDDVINVSGHRLGTSEIEDIIDEHPNIAETAAVGYPHDIKGEGVYVYITLKDGVTEPTENIISEVKSLVKTQMASFAVPDLVQVSPGLPKTRSGKIMRRILRQVAAGETQLLGDTSTIADPSVVTEIINNHAKLVAK